MLAKNKPWLVGLVYSLVALLVVSPLLRPGFILTFDLVFTPTIPPPRSLTNLWLYQELTHLLSFVLPAQLIEKLLIFAILLLCGVSMHYLVQTRSSWPRYAAGIFYMVNPFTYERWMAGQYLIVAGYALLPLVLRATLQLLVRPTRRRMCGLAAWLAATALLSVHMLVLAALLVIICAVIRLCRPLAQPNYRRSLLVTLVGSFGLFAVASSYWLWGVVRGTSAINKTISGITATDVSAFMTAGNHHSLLLNVLGGYGFWLERYHRYAVAQPAVLVIGFLLVASLVLLGLRAQYRARSAAGLGLAIAALLGLVVALGIHAPITGPLVRFAITHVPLMRGFREPEKFSALLLLAYAYFMAHGLDYLQRRLAQRPPLTQYGLRYGALLLPLFYTATMPFAFAGQLTPVHYPAAWYDFNRTLSYAPAKGSVLFLPWHQYMSYDFSPRISANPAPDFFAPAHIIAGTNAEFGGVVDPTPTADSTFIESQFLSRPDRTDLGTLLAQRNIEYVLLSRGYGYQGYDFLRHQHDLTPVSSQPGLTVYRNEAYHG